VPTKWRKFEKIPQETEALFIQKVLYKEALTWEEAEKIYNCLHSSIGRILKKEKDRQLGVSVPAPKKRGRKSSIQPYMLSFILYAFEINSQLTLKDMVVDLENHFQIETSKSALN
jgi:hypothetical protein